ncbi:MAG: type-F conjugative transfer system pilin assembly protein TrbC [Bacillota bacterium]|nr:type-F conjugative transfer system pilin assembly protein TrbC [Bacillota bacterium]
MCYNLLLFINALFLFLTLTDGYATVQDCESLQKQKACRACSETSLQTSLMQEPARKNDFYQNSDYLDSFFKLLQQESLQKVEALQRDPAFQETVKTLENNSPQSQYTESNSSPETQANLNGANLNEASFYIFISFSMGEKALLNLAHEVKQFEATLVLRGFHEGSYVKTAQALQKIITKTGQGVIIDPELYSLFDITAVPSFVLAKPFNVIAAERTQTPMHDKLQGHVSVHYALETFAKEGDLKNEDQTLLKRGSTK